MITVQVTPLHQGVELPRYETPGAAGMDLRAWLPDGRRFLATGTPILIPTGLAIAIPEGYEAQIRPRSGLAIKHGVTVANSPGTIDSDYRGEIKVALVNLTDVVFEVNHGDRIAQIVFAPVERCQFANVSKLPESQRGAGGFGSTGSK